MRNSFKERKAEKLNEINIRGGNLKTEKEAVEKELETIQSRIENGMKYIAALKDDVVSLESILKAEEAKINPSQDVDKTLLLANKLLENSMYQAKKKELEDNGI